MTDVFNLQSPDIAVLRLGVFGNLCMRTYMTQTGEYRVEEQDIKRAGLKVTQPRVKILDLLTNSVDRHLSAEEIYRMLLANGDEIGLATVYRVLTQFETGGLIHRHNFEGGQAVFELASDDHHDHMVCVHTGKVVEFYDEIIEQRQKEIAREHGFEITDHSLILYGKFVEKS